MRRSLRRGRIRVHFFDVGVDVTAPAARECARQEILFDREVREAVTPFHYLHDTALDDLGGTELIDALRAEFDRTFGHVTALCAQQV